MDRESLSPSSDFARPLCFRFSYRLVNQGCKLVGCGSAVPDDLISNVDLSKIVDTNDEWISVRTGIRNRRILSRNESLTSLAVEAARKVLEMADLLPDEVDLVLLCTTSEDLFGGAPQDLCDMSPYSVSYIWSSSTDLFFSDPVIKGY